MAASVIVHRLAQPRAPVSSVTAISELSSEISVKDRRVVECSAAAGRCQVPGGVRTLGGVYGSNFQRLGSPLTTAPSNNALKRRRAKTHAP